VTTPTEAVALSKYIRAHFPQQPLDEYSAEALCELVGRYPVTDARAAVLAIADRGEHWCSPSDVRAEVKRIRGKRIEQHPPLTPPPGDVLEQQAWLKEARRRIGDGETIDSDAGYGELKPRHLPDLRALMPKVDEDEQTRIADGDDEPPALEAS
jgi:hypothetical protein